MKYKLLGIAMGAIIALCAMSPLLFRWHRTVLAPARPDGVVIIVDKESTGGVRVLTGTNRHEQMMETLTNWLEETKPK